SRRASRSRCSRSATLGCSCSRSRAASSMLNYDRVQFECEPDPVAASARSLRPDAFELWVGSEPIAGLSETHAAVCITGSSVHDLVDRYARTHPVIGHPEGREQLRELIRRFADALYSSLTSPASDRLVFREAVAFLLETEMFWHWPIRQMTRRLARSTPPG